MKEYAKICKRAVEDDLMFNTFKSKREYRKILEHVSFTQGLQYLQEIKDQYPYLLSYISKFITNDHIGTPNRFWYNDILENISPTTLRYIKVLGDLTKYFNLQDMDIVEIGGGYGGQCKIIHDFVKPHSYTIIDLPEVVHLVGKYLSKFDIEAILKDNTKDLKDKYDLCISNYAFSELSRRCQLVYLDVINRSENGYFICNAIDPLGDNMKKGDILKLKSNGVLLDEVPLSAPGNYLYLWKKGVTKEQDN